MNLRLVTIKKGEIMIIDVKQIKTNLEIKFEIYYDEKLHNIGTCSRSSSVFSTKMYTLEGDIVFSTKFNPITQVTSWIPFKWLWSKQKSNVNYILDNTGQNIGKIEHVTEGLFYSYHIIECLSTALKIYSISLGEEDYYMIYRNETQIGMIVKNSYIKNNLDYYKLYLLDDFTDYSDVLSLFILYCDNNYYGNRNEIVAYKTEKSWEYSFSRTDKFFNAQWLKENFELKEIEYEEIRKKGKIVSILFLGCFFTLLIVIIYYKFLA
ncbi:hypothetical protein [Abyssisolibacter fermentans]|uniref:hypothetical protein n=1 Tax=Abyssisolibacter fermentans TaxID=1766203 RepID=UPI0012E3A3CD|nr:hypothetical protein [Abyssisolibacter fermentans]